MAQHTVLYRNAAVAISASFASMPIVPYTGDNVGNNQFLPPIPLELVFAAAFGANLSAAVSLISRNKNGPKITCQILIYPSTNIYKLNSESWSYFANDFNISTEEMEKYISIYIPEKEDRKTP